jgi:hypothetical protein
MYIIIFLNAFLLVLWFNTEVFVEYFKLTGNLFKIKEYILDKPNDFSLTYHSFLLKKYNCFFTRLITCPLCFNFWITLLFTIVFNYEFILIPTIYILSLLIYFIFTKLSP